MLKKSQITVFIIISLVALVMIGVAYYMLTTTAVLRGEESIMRQEISAAKIGPLKEYITSCLSLASSEGLELLGKQGGYIYKSQGGIVDDPQPGESGKEFIDYEQTKVHYNIYAPISNVGMIFFAQTPNYPWPTFPEIRDPLTWEIIQAERFEGYFGRNRIPLLEKPNENSIQEQLETFCLNSLLMCIDWTSFTQQGLDITSEVPNVSAVFADRDVTFMLNWPIKVNDIATGAVTELSEFVVVYPVRLKKIHEFTSVIMDMDVRNISYDIRASDTQISSSIFPDIFGSDDMIVVKDTESKVLDREYAFRFMRKNRAPALFYIHNITSPVCNGSLVQAVPPNKLNIVDSCNENSLELNFTAIDPDEASSFNFTYDRQLPIEISYLDASLGKLTIKVLVSDGEYTDWQEITIPARSS